MVEVVSIQPYPEQDKNQQSFEESNSFLKLVVSNPTPFTETTDSQVPTYNISSHAFTAKVHEKGNYIYEMTLWDPSHYLACDVFLEITEGNQKNKGRTVICHFPTVNDEELNDFVEKDDTLYGAFMVQFQMKIFEQLFLFCFTHNASTLVIFADDDQSNALGVYHDFLAYEDRTLTSNGTKTKIVIPVNQETFNAWVAFMEEATVEFQQTLWRQQKTNPVIRRYLKMKCSRIRTHKEEN
jgi:hypothetical protein